MSNRDKRSPIAIARLRIAAALALLAAVITRDRSIAAARRKARDRSRRSLARLLASFAIARDISLLYIVSRFASFAARLLRSLSRPLADVITCGRLLSLSLSLACSRSLIFALALLIPVDYTKCNQYLVTFQGQNGGILPDFFHYVKLKVAFW
jgi:hypothetical protein